jgi:hypothetical protein
VNPIHQWGSQASEETLTGAEIWLEAHPDDGFAELYWQYKGDVETVRAVLQKYVIGYEIELPLDMKKPRVLEHGANMAATPTVDLKVIPAKKK